jgi:hypothetical protein
VPVEDKTGSSGWNGHHGPYPKVLCLGEIIVAIEERHGQKRLTSSVGRSIGPLALGETYRERSTWKKEHGHNGNLDLLVKS